MVWHYEICYPLYRPREHLQIWQKATLTNYFTEAAGIKVRKLQDERKI